MHNLYCIDRATEDGDISTKENVAYHLVPPDQSTLEDEIYSQPEPQDYIYPPKNRSDSPEDYAVPIPKSQDVTSIDIEPEHIYD